MTKKLCGSRASREKPPTYEIHTTSEKEVVLAASPSLEGGDEPEGQNRRTARPEWRKGRRGFVSPIRKLTDEQAIEIRYLVGSRKLSERAAGKRFGVSTKTIRGILAGKLYVKPGPKRQPSALVLPVVAPFPPRPVVDCGRSYGRFPLKQRSA